MTQGAKFCSTCGKGLVEGARFCAGCGTPVVAATPVPQPAPEAVAHPAVAPQPVVPAPPVVAPQPVATAPASSERVHAVIPNATLKGGFLGMGGKSYILVLTERRVLFVQVTSQMMKQMVADARDNAKSDGKGFFGQWGAQLSAYSEFATRYLTMAPEQALAETPGNWALERAAIVSVKLKAGYTDTDGGGSSPDRLIIKATDKKHTIDLASGTAQAKQALIAAEMI